MKCSKCKNKAIIFIPYLNKAFCERHFLESFEKRVKNCIKKYKLISKNDKIVVGVSGGKDSLSLLYFLNKNYKNKIFSLTIDEGIHNYRNETIKLVKKYCEEWGIKSIIVSFKHEFGLSLDEIIKKIKEIPCAPCGILRRYFLNKYAKKFGTKLATAHNLDDEAQSILMNIFQNNIHKLVRLGPISGIKQDPKFIPRIKPFRMVSEKEIVIYALLNGIEVSYDQCPYAHFSFRDIVRKELNNYEFMHPGTKMNILKNFDKLKLKFLKNYNPPYRFKYCKICSEPTSYTEICEACNLLEKLRK